MLRYAITDRKCLAGQERERAAELIRQAKRWAERGVDFIQLREKDLQAGALAELARRMIEVLRSQNKPPKVLVNSRVDVAVAVAADGVHLTSAPGSLTIAQVRGLYAAAGLPEAVVSVSCHTLAEVAAAREAGASVVVFGPVFEKRVAGQIVVEGSGLGLLRSAVEVAGPVPVLALGGVTAERVAECIQAGASGVAAIRLFYGQNMTDTGPGVLE